MTIPKIREDAVKSFKNNFDFDVYSSLTTLESRDDPVTRFNFDFKSHIKFEPELGIDECEIVDPELRGLKY